MESLMGFERESLGSNWSCVTSVNNGYQSPTLFNSSQQQQQNRTPSSKSGDTCHRCKKQGHWAKDCTESASPMVEPPSPQRVLGIDGLLYEPCFVCDKCGRGCCIRVSPATPGRQYYHCLKCRLNVKWVDKVKSYEIINVPICKCLAGTCRLSTQRSGGRRCFVCPIKKGQGACDFSLLVGGRVMTSNGHVDEIISSPPSTLTNCDDTSPASSGLVEEGDYSHKGMEIESPAVDTPQCSPSQGATSGQPKRGKIVEMELEVEEEMSNEPHHKRLRHGGFDCSVLDFTNEGVITSRKNSKDSLMEEELQASVLRTEAEIDWRQVDFLSQISIEGLPASSSSSYYSSFASPSNSMPPREDCLVTAATGKNLGFHVHDWLGRLAFPPSRCLMMPAPKPFFCCVFPCFNPVLAPQNVDAFDGEASSILPLSLLATENNKISRFSGGQNAQLSSVAHWEASSLKSHPGMERVNAMTDVVSEGFAQLAMQLQNHLVMILESTDIRDYKLMVSEASTTFSALDRLLIDYRPFCEQVKEFITGASCLAEIDSSISNDQKIVERYNCEKKRLDEISCRHDEAMVGLEASRERLRSLGEKASNLKEMLFQIETEFLCCEVENQERERSFARLSNERVESERGLQVVSEAAEEALKVCYRREEDRRAAEAAFEKARMLLRQ